MYSRAGELCVISLREEDSHRFFEILLQSELVSSLPRIYSVIYLNQYGLMDIYFMHRVIIKYFFIFLLRLLHLWPLEALSVGSWVPLTQPYGCDVVVVVIFWDHEMV